ncbi:MAG: succinate dehydrogenase, hydrophobic membrane anchor protein [Alphaproteobacteria bacterium]|nr:succinate dehydrogenase, hydrophobic membrane anchor protein [Alphaproteobacteria bacterium]MBV9695122.1 succinate dehydrogenase, hydrophobic membrane anchor protein [Alphaproteobacteria bacterium]
MSMETPLHRVQGLGPAHAGVKHFWRERVTAAALVPLSIWFAWAVLGLVGANEPQVLTFLARSSFGVPLNAILLGAFIVIMVYHMALGLQVVIEDYVHGEGAKIFLLLATRAFGVAIVAVCVYALLSIARAV